MFFFATVLAKENELKDVLQEKNCLTLELVSLTQKALQYDQHMREAAERRQQLELEHEQAFAVLNAKQQEINLLQKKCRTQSEQFNLLSKELEKFRLQAGHFDLLSANSLAVCDTPGSPSRSLSQLLHALAIPIGKGSESPSANRSLISEFIRPIQISGDKPELLSVKPTFLTRSHPSSLRRGFLAEVSQRNSPYWNLQPLKVYHGKFVHYNPYDGPNENPEAELPLIAGKYIYVYGNMDEDGFYEGELLDGQRGLVPSNFVDFIQDEEVPSVQTADNGKDQAYLNHTGLGHERGSGILTDSRFDGSMSGEAITTTTPTTTTTCSNGTGTLDVSIDEIGEDIVPYPRKINLIKQLAKSVIVGWEPPVVPPAWGTISGYNVLVDKEVRMSIPFGGRTKFLIEKLNLSACTYRISIQSITGRGISEELRCTMLVGKDVVVAPYQLRVDNITQVSAELSWWPSNSNYSHTIFLNDVEYDMVKAASYRYQFFNLKPNMTYKVKVVAQPHQMPWQLPLEQREKREITVEFCTQPAEVNTHTETHTETCNQRRGEERRGEVNTHTETHTETCNQRRGEERRGEVNTHTETHTETCNQRRGEERRGEERRGPPAPPLDVMVQSGPAPGLIQVSWKPPPLTQMGMSNGANVIGYAVCTRGQKVAEVMFPTADSVMVELMRLQCLGANEVIVRTISAQGESQDSPLAVIPHSLLLPPVPHPRSAPNSKPLASAREPETKEEPGTVHSVRLTEPWEPARSPSPIHPGHSLEPPHFHSPSQGRRSPSPQRILPQPQGAPIPNTVAKAIAREAAQRVAESNRVEKRNIFSERSTAIHPLNSDEEEDGYESPHRKRQGASVDEFLRGSELGRQVEKRNIFSERSTAIHPLNSDEEEDGYESPHRKRQGASVDEFLRGSELGRQPLQYSHSEDYQTESSRGSDLSDIMEEDEEELYSEMQLEEGGRRRSITSHSALKVEKRNIFSERSTAIHPLNSDEEEDGYESPHRKRQGASVDEFLRGSELGRQPLQYSHSEDYQTESSRGSDLSDIMEEDEEELYSEMQLEEGGRRRSITSHSALKILGDPSSTGRADRMDHSGRRLSHGSAVQQRPQPMMVPSIEITMDSNSEAGRSQSGGQRNVSPVKEDVYYRTVPGHRKWPLQRGMASEHRYDGYGGRERHSPEFYEESEPEDTSRIFVALFDYDPLSMSPNPDAADEELPFKEGQIMKVYGDKDTDGFYRGEICGRVGLIPCNMVSEIQTDDDEMMEKLIKQGFLPLNTPILGDPSSTGRADRMDHSGRRLSHGSAVQQRPQPMMVPSIEITMDSNSEAGLSRPGGQRNVSPVKEDVYYRTVPGHRKWPLQRGMASEHRYDGYGGRERHSPEFYEESEPEDTSRIFVALFDYDPLSMSPNPDAADEELPFKEGQIMKVYGDKDTDGFYRGEICGRDGLIPCNMVSEIQTDDDEMMEKLIKQGFLPLNTPVEKIELEWKLSESGAIKTDLEENPKKQIEDKLMTSIRCTALTKKDSDSEDDY
ncbi:UNVERIFIED_CONTAM: hypothetical protein FKN15_034004 [Acipenser sinensis]